MEGFMEVELMVTKRDDNRRRPTDRVNIEQSASGRWNGRVLQKHRKNYETALTGQRKA